MPRESLFGFLKSSSNKSGMGNTGGIFSARVRYVMLEGETHPEVFKQYGEYQSIGGLFFNQLDISQ